LVHEQLHVPGILRVAQLLDDDGPLEAGLPDEHALEDRPHAAGAQLLEHLVLGFLGHGLFAVERAGSMTERPRDRQASGPRVCPPGGTSGLIRPPGITLGAPWPRRPTSYTRLRMRILGLDVGDRTIGVALSDES